MKNRVPLSVQRLMDRLEAANRKSAGALMAREYHLLTLSKRLHRSGIFEFGSLFDFDNEKSNNKPFRVEDYEDG